jgi:hypothetical protein
MSIWKEEWPVKKSSSLKRLLCLLGKHHWVQGKHRKTGSVVAHLIFPVHEMEADYRCKHCLKDTVKSGLSSSPLRAFSPRDFPIDPVDGWPLDSEGNRLPFKRKT